MAYLTSTQIQTRLTSRFELSATVNEGDADIASADLDASGPFVGAKQDEAQEEQFPRNTNPDGTANTSTTVPEPVLDWVALRAYELASDEDPAIQSEGISDLRVTYASPRISQTQRRMENLLRPYLADVPGLSSIEVASSFWREV